MALAFFSAPLDALDSPQKLMCKAAHLQSLLAGEVAEPNYSDPFAALRPAITSLASRLGGKVIEPFPLETWLTPKPALEDIPKISPELFTSFLDEGGLARLSRQIEDFVEQNVFPDWPVVVGVDHSLTGGILRALTRRVGKDNLAVVVFDAHFDAIPIAIRKGLAEYAQEISGSCEEDLLTVFPGARSADPPNAYSAGSFLWHILEEGVILPDALTVVGAVDAPDESMRQVEDARVKKFVEEYDRLLGKGCRVLSKKMLTSPGGITRFENILDETKKEYLYVSFDVDVAASTEVYAAQFQDFVGLKGDIVLDIARAIHKRLEKGTFKLAGLDVVEIDTYLLDVEERIETEHKTTDFVAKFLDALLV